ncbi:MAG: phosphodiesterase [Phyllobacteriaceae bacterium]|nr:phosphodiesterase [Phyllobacteriaceae bacterium]
MKIIQITDTHIVRSGGRVNGVDPEANLRGAVADVLVRHWDADLLVITGDLCNDGDPAAYALLRDILAPVPFPVRLCLGNHDGRDAFVEAFPDHPRAASGHVQSFSDTPFGRLLFLDTNESGLIGGLYDAPRLAWLDEALAGAGPLPITVFLHHPPVSDGLAHFEHIRLHDDGAVMARLKRHPGGIRHVVFGHVHVPLCGTDPDGVAFSSGQACAHRFVTDPACPTPLWTGGDPCYRVITIDALGFRAYDAQVGQTVLGRADPCAGP